MITLNSIEEQVENYQQGERTLALRDEIFHHYSSWIDQSSRNVFYRNAKGTSHGLDIDDAKTIGAMAFLTKLEKKDYQSLRKPEGYFFPAIRGRIRDAIREGKDKGFDRDFVREIRKIENERRVNNQYGLSQNEVREKLQEKHPRMQENSFQLAYQHVYYPSVRINADNKGNTNKKMVHAMNDSNGQHRIVYNEIFEQHLGDLLKDELIILLAPLLGYTTEEIAQIVDRPRSSVETVRSRLKKQLREDKEYNEHSLSQEVN